MARAVYYNEFQKVLNGVLVPAVNAEVTIYEAGTSTPIIATMYAARSGGTTLTNPLTADAEGSIQFYTDLPQAIKVVATATGLGTVTVDDQLVLTDQSSYANPTFTGQARFATGTTSAPSIAKTGDTDTGVNLLSTANVLQLVSGGVAAIVANVDSSTAMVRIDRDGNVDASLLSMTHYNGSGGVDSDKYTLDVIRYTDGGGTAISGVAHGADGVGGVIAGGRFVADAGAGWDPDDGGANGLIIGVLAQADGSVDDAKCYGANVFGFATSSAQDVTVVGIEVDVGGTTGSTVATRYGVMAVSNDSAAVQATGEDVAFRVAAKGSGSKWKTGFLIDSNGGAWPMDPAGTLFDARTGGGAAKGVDFSTVTFTHSSFLATGFMVNPIGRVGIRVAGVEAAPLRMDATGDTWNLVIDNAVVAGAAGADTGTYMTIKLSGTTYKLKLYAAS